MDYNNLLFILTYIILKAKTLLKNGLYTKVEYIVLCVCVCVCVWEMREGREWIILINVV